MMEYTHRLSPAVSIEHVAEARTVWTKQQWNSTRQAALHRRSTIGCAFHACGARGFGLPRTGWRTPQRFLTRHLATDSFTSKLQSPSGTRSSRWRRSKGSATLSALSARCLSSRRSLNDYQGPTDAIASTPHSVRIPSTNDVPLHPRRYDYHWSGVGHYLCGCPTTRMTLPTLSEPSAARISSSIARSQSV